MEDNSTYAASSTGAAATRAETSPSDRAAFPAGNMAERVRDHDWSATPVGALANWPASLLTAVNLCLASRFPMAVCWGERLTLIYNDAYAALIGGQHPAALGQPCAQLCNELRPILEPLLTGVMQSGETTWSSDLMLPLHRHGYSEEAFFAVSFSAIREPGEGQATAGILLTLTETTERVLAERRLRLLRDLAQSADHARSPEGVCADATELLAAHAHDIPFSLIYLLGPAGDAYLARPAAAFLPGPAAPVSLPVSHGCKDGDEPRGWPIARVLATGDRVVVADLPRRFPSIVAPVWPEPVDTAVVLPIPRPGPSHGRPFGLLILGVSPRRRLDPRALDFHKLVACHLGQALTSAEAYRAQGVLRAGAPPAAVDRQAVARYRAEVYDLIMQAPAPFCVLGGPELTFELANPAFVQLVGRDHLIGRALLQALPELRGQGIADILREVMRSGVAQVGHESRTRLPGPGMVAGGAQAGEAQAAVQDRHWSFIYSPLRTPGEPAARVMVLAWEVTDQMKVRADLEKARHLAEEASSAKDQFLAMLGHELRNPLSPILTALQLMTLRGLRSREQDVIERQVGHLVRLVDDLLDVARITRGKVELRREPLELAGVVVRGIELASPLLEQRKQRLHVDVPPDGLTVHADPARLAQVISNLLTNASKYSEPGSHIFVSASREGSHARLIVRDEGIGIAPEMLDAIFESFVQQRQGPDRSAGGLGLGLAIVRRLVRAHGGTVRARSGGPGQGSAFEVELPLGESFVVESTGDSDRLYLHEPLPPSEAPAPARPAVANPDTNRVLVVDDNLDGAQVLAETLRELGHAVEVAHDGPTALEIARRWKPQIALLDIGLPVMDGYELAGRLRELGGPLRLVAVTGYGQESDRRRSREAGFAAHLVKPVDLDVLTTVIGHHN
jgi:signal transduction histidine kinase